MDRYLKIAILNWIIAAIGIWLIGCATPQPAEIYRPWCRDDVLRAAACIAEQTGETVWIATGETDESREVHRWMTHGTSEFKGGYVWIKNGSSLWRIKPPKYQYHAQCVTFRAGVPVWWHWNGDGYVPCNEPEGFAPEKLYTPDEYHDIRYGRLSRLNAGRGYMEVIP